MVKIIKLKYTKKEIEQIEKSDSECSKNENRKKAETYIEENSQIYCDRCYALLEATKEDIFTNEGYIYYIKCPNCEHRIDVPKIWND